MKWGVVIRILGVCCGFWLGMAYASADRCPPGSSFSELALDGYLSDWNGVPKTSLRDIRVQCVEGESLNLAFTIADKTIIRSTEKKRNNDSIRIELNVDGGRPLILLAQPGTEDAEPLFSAPSGVAMSDSLTEGGWALEVKVPWNLLPGWTEVVPNISLKLSYRDAQKGSKSGFREIGKTKLSLRGSDSTYRLLLKTIGQNQKAVVLDELADIDLGDGPERVVVAGKYLGVIGRDYRYMSLPIAGAKDLVRAEIVELGTNGNSLVAIEYRLRNHKDGQPASRTILGLWRLDGTGGFEQVLALETGRTVGPNNWNGTWRVVANRKLKRDPLWGDNTGKGKSIVLEGPSAAPPALTPFEDVYSLPETPPPATAFVFDDGIFSGTVELKKSALEHHRPN